MSPARRTSSTYRPKRDRREVTIAVLTGVAILVFTALMVWVLGPHDDGGDNSPSTTTAPAATTTAPATGSTTAPATTAPATTAPATTAPATTAPASTSTSAGGG